MYTKRQIDKWLGADAGRRSNSGKRQEIGRQICTDKDEQEGRHSVIQAVTQVDSLMNGEQRMSPRC